MTKASVLPAAAIALGIILLAASFLWPRIADRNAYWSEEQAKLRAESGLLLKVLPHELAEAKSDAAQKRIQREIDAASEQYNQTDIDIHRAKTRFERPVTALRWSGTLCLLLGVAIYYAFREL